MLHSDRRAWPARATESPHRASPVPKDRRQCRYTGCQTRDRRRLPFCIPRWPCRSYLGSCRSTPKKCALPLWVGYRWIPCKGGSRHRAPLASAAGRLPERGAKLSRWLLSLPLLPPARLLVELSALILSGGHALFLQLLLALHAQVVALTERFVADPFLARVANAAAQLHDFAADHALLFLRFHKTILAQMRSSLQDLFTSALGFCTARGQFNTLIFAGSSKIISSPYLGSSLMAPVISTSRPSYCERLILARSKSSAVDEKTTAVRADFAGPKSRK